MQHSVSMRFLRPLFDDVGIPPSSRKIAVGDIHPVLSGHASWLEERGFAERVVPPTYYAPMCSDSALSGFVSEMETSMKGPYENKAIVPAVRKRGRPKGSKNKPKKSAAQ